MSLTALIVVVALGCRGGDRTTGPEGPDAGGAGSGSSILIENVEPAAYGQDTLEAGDTVYVDRKYVFEGVPGDYGGWHYVRTANDDKSVNSDSAVAFTLTDTARVALAYDERASILPDWLHDWTATGDTLRTTDIDYAIHTRVFAPGDVVLGGNLSGGAEGAESMYVLSASRTGSSPDVGSGGDSGTDTSSGSGSLQVVTTTGDSLDSDGYTVSVDGGSGQAIGINDANVFADLTAESHTVELSGVASNCSTSGSNPRSVSVAENDTVSTTFEVSCDTATTSTGDTHPNEPSGMTELTTNNYSSLPGPQDVGNGWFVNGDISVVSDVSALMSSPDVGQIRYPAGFDDGGTPGYSGVSKWGPGNVVYFHYWVKYSSNFQVHPALAKFGYLTDSSEGGGGAPLFWGVKGTGLELEFRTQNPDISPSNVNYGANVGSGTISRGEWHEVEAVVRYNTGSNADGEIHAWLDGTKSHEYTDVKFGASGDHSFDSWRWEPIWGGNSGETVDSEMFIWVDHVYISTK